MNLPKVPRDQLAKLIQRRAIEIAADEGDDIDIPVPGISVLRKPTGIFGIRWALSDYQNVRGAGCLQVAAAEMSARWDIEADD